MNIIEPGIDAYAEAHTTPSGELYERLAAETRETTEWPEMMVGEVEGRLLEFLVRFRGARNKKSSVCGKGTIALPNAATGVIPAIPYGPSTEGRRRVGVRVLGVRMVASCLDSGA